MGIGFSMFLVALGAILTFALDFKVVGVDIQVIGWILIASGAAGLVLTMVVADPLRHRYSNTTLSRGAVPLGQPAGSVTRTSLTSRSGARSHDSRTHP